MAKDYQQQIEEVSPGSFPEEMRGAIIDARDESRNGLWITLTVISIVTVMLCAWAYLHYGRSDEELLRDKLANRHMVRQMLSDSEQTIANPTASLAAVREAVDQAVAVTQTPLRLGTSPTSPPIPERYQAMVVALEGYLRLAIVHELEKSDSAEARKILTALGGCQVDYYLSGIKQWIPLMRSAAIRQEIALIAPSDDPTTPDRVANLREKLKSLEDHESETVATAALTLGKWFHYRNDKKLAHRALEIGRKYIEGVTINGHYYPGRDTDGLSPLWDEYARCLESLAEIAFFDKHYREARSYLQRLFNTPDGTSPLDDKLAKSSRELASRQRIANLKSDITLIERAIASPLDLPSYPRFTAGENQINWSALAREMRTARLLAGRGIQKILWENLSPAAQQTLLSAEESTPSPSARAEVLTGLNILLDDPSLSRRAGFDPQQLSTRARELLELANSRELSNEERHFLHRSLVEAAFPEGISREYLLSDGSHLHNFLSPRQTSQLLALYQERLTASPDNALSEQVRDIYQERLRPTLQDLHTELRARRSWYRSLAHEAYQHKEKQGLLLQQLRQETRRLEEAPTLDLDTLITFKEQEEAAEDRIQEARLQIHRAEAEVAATEQELEDLTLDLRQQLAEAQAQLEILVNEGTAAPASENLKNKPELAQIERQIALHSKYRSLLEGLRDSRGDVKLQALHAENTELTRRIKLLTARRDASTGDTREQTDQQLSMLLDRQHQVLTEINSHFDPIREIVAEIATDENRIWEAEKTLKQTREEILKLIGTGVVPGSLSERAQRRARLVLSEPDDAQGMPLYEAEIHRLNEEIASDYTRLHLLLQTERQAMEQLTTFYPQILDNSGGSALASLQRYLKEQQELMEQYQVLWQQDGLQKQIQEQEQAILDNLTQIDQALTASDELSDKQTLILSRSIANVFAAKKRVAMLQRQLQNAMTRSSSRILSSQTVSGRGFLLDSTELFQIEHQMGLNLRQYRRVFEERQALVGEIAQVIGERRLLENQKLNALRQRDQQQIDLLLPRLADKERRLASLSTTLASIDRQLRTLSNEYRQSHDNVQAYRKRLMPEMDMVNESISQLDQKMMANDANLENLASQVVDTKQQFDKVVTSLGIEDLRGLDELIVHQNQVLKHLTRVRDERLTEHYYQAKALFLLGKTLDYQSRLSEYQELVTAQALPVEMIDDDRRHGKQLVNEYDYSTTYATQFIEADVDDDGQRINIAMWRDTLEKQAIEIFLHELPLYTSDLADDPVTAKTLSNTMRWDIESYIAQSRFFAGEVYLRRGMRQQMASTQPTSPNLQAQQELARAAAAFQSVIRYSDNFEGELTATNAADKSFPINKRYPLALAGKADLYLGTIAAAEGDDLRAIEHYRHMLARLDNSDQVDPIATAGARFQNEVAPEFSSMLAQHPLAHEVIYRLGHSYESLAHQAYDRAKADQPAEEVLAEEYAGKALAYYSQLTLTHAYSPFRRAAHLHRARTAQLLNRYEMARADLIAILGDPVDPIGPWEGEHIVLAGELPSDLHPSHAFVAFELGKLYLDQGDYVAAVDVLEQAKQGEADPAFVIQAKVAYAEALKETDNLAMAHLFLQQLNTERTNAPPELERYYPPELVLDLADVQQSMGNLNAAERTLDGLIALAPGHLRDGNRLNLTSQYGMALLQSDYRDLIRPLAEGCEKAGDIALSLRNYDLARFHYSNGQILFALVPWQQDRLLRDGSQEAWQQYIDQHSLACRWGGLKCDAQEVLFDSVAHFRRSMENPDSADVEAIREILKQTAQQAESDTQLYNELARRVDSFYQENYLRLPEVLARQEIRERQRRDRDRGGEGMLRYRSLTRLRNTLLSTTTETPTQLLEAIAAQFGVESVEEKLLDNFALAHAKTLELSDNDRRLMDDGRGNLENLMRIEDADTRLANVSDALKLWIEVKMQETGLDDMFVAASPQGAVIEDVALHQVAILAALNDYDSYNKLATIADDTLQRRQMSPPLVQNGDAAWQMASIAAAAAQEQKDWQRLAGYARYLVDAIHLPVFSPVEKLQLATHRFQLATALTELATKDYEDMVFLYEEEERKRLQQRAMSRREEARKLLTQLQQLPGQQAQAITMRIVAGKMLKELQG